MMAALPAAAAKPAARSVVVMLLVRLAAVHVVSIYACIFTVIHWLHDVPIKDSWIIGVVGFVMLFLATGVMINGRLLGFFSTQSRRFSVDWLPLLLIWPMGLSIWACFGLGLASIQARQELANGVALPLVILAATVPPLLLGRLPAWPLPGKPWQRVLDGHYALASFAAALTLFLAMQSALGQPSPAPTSTTATNAAAKPAATGFACNPNRTVTTGDPEVDEDNKCPATPPPTSTTATTAAASTATTIQAAARPIDQNLSAWGGTWMVISGLLLGLARLLTTKRGGAAVPTGEVAAAVTGAETALAGLAGPGRELAGELMSAAQTQIAAQATSWLSSSGIPGADLISGMMGKVLKGAPPTAPAAGGQATAASPLASLEAAIPTPAGLAATVPGAVAAPAATTLAAVPAPAASASPFADAAPAAIAPAPSSPPVPPPPPATTPAPAATASAPAPPPPAADNPEAAALRAQVKDMNAALAKQQDAASQLQSNVATLQDKLDKQTQMVNQVMAEGQRAADESRRTIDSLTRLMQGMKADLERLSRNQTGGA